MGKNTVLFLVVAVLIIVGAFFVFTFLLLLPAIPSIRSVFNVKTTPEQLNVVLGFTGKYLLLNSIVFSVLWIY